MKTCYDHGNSRKNGIAKHAGAGATDAIRKALAAGPKTLDAICQHTGLRREILGPAANQLVSMGGLVRYRLRGKTLYALFKDAPQPEAPAAREFGEFAIPVKAGRITIPQFHTGWGRL